MTCCFALCVPSASISTGLCPWLRVATAFSSPSCPTRAMYKNAVSFFLREVIHGAEVLDAATWSSSSVFTSFYLRDLQHEFQGLCSLGLFVAAGSRIS